MSRLKTQTIKLMCKASALGMAIGLSNIAAFAQLNVPLAKSGDISVNSARPLWKALEIVSGRTHMPINVEDVPYQNANDLIKHNTLTKYGTHIHAVEPRGGIMRVSLSKGQSACDAVQDVLYAYSNAALPGAYRSVCYQDRIDVVPVSYTDVKGDTKAAMPLMNQPISFPEAERPVVVTFQVIVDALSKATGVNVSLGMTPFLGNTMITIGASKEPMENVIARMGAKLRPMSFWLAYGPEIKGYVLNARLVPFAPASSAGAAPQGSSGPTVTQPKGNPWFTKE